MLLLRAVYAEFKTEVDEVEGELDWTNGELPIVPHYLFEWLQDEEKKEGIVKRLRRAMEQIVREYGMESLMEVRGVVADDLRGVRGRIDLVSSE